MPSLKDLRNRIASVKSTQRITSAMKMVAAAKLRRAQEHAMAARPYAERMEGMLRSLAGGASVGSSPLLAGTGADDTHLLVLISADRGLCGGFNISLMRGLRERVGELQSAGKTVKLFIIGRKGVGLVRREFPDLILEIAEDVSKPAPSFDAARDIAENITQRFDAGEFDSCTVIYNKFVSALTQIVTPQQLIPFALPSDEEDDDGEENAGSAAAAYEYEPSEEEILDELLPRNVSMQIFKAMLESFASEQGARMTAMDNATRNAGDMINKLTLNYNRSRQAQITKELIEIISGAEAL
ncbi:MAG TPA: F0F1 ATP synthase subunit gamma [Rhodospirillaceae bacterium]|nr:F0F1 ATP synthase subunit gamma [Rhodospirillaceae bacterium]HAT35990.1 F0F1 ATP synthase subunit gamma [Rhodospirillaceae bacterium]